MKTSSSDKEKKAVEHWQGSSLLIKSQCLGNYELIKSEKIRFKLLSQMALFVNSNLAFNLLDYCTIYQQLTRKIFAGKFNDKLIDTTRAITEDGSIEIVTPDSKDALPIFASLSRLTCLQYVASSQTSTCVGPYRRWFLLTMKRDKFLTKTFRTKEKWRKSLKKKTSHHLWRSD